MTISFFRDAGKAKASAKRQRRSQLLQKLDHLRQLELQPRHDSLHSEVLLAATELRALDAAEAAGARVQSRTNLIREGDAPSRYFFNQLHLKHKNEDINAVQNEN
ncbi:hypothetical protein O6H91_05G053900 [Diphasiastrum complanatum]|uniref:Uncharacterized protein n=1 Tax=Diphasiastrum complanatum TaxID=34168 RepID=A0ACC2DN93_DIPCM|nr:hypothetical protein O6H91_05G053900 [Diphasiastrum complanatum]